MSDVKIEPADAGEQPSETGSHPDEKASKLHERALARLREVRTKATHVRVVVVENGKKATRATDDFVHEYPWTCIGIAAGVGVLVGLLINRD
jgi:ElaB/YqjD/DUF883 family membrane-anchored ribosome-binding protein